MDWRCAFLFRGVGMAWMRRPRFLLMTMMKFNFYRSAPAWGLGWAGVLALLLAGCTARQYRRTADDRNYQIIAQTERGC